MMPLTKVFAPADLLSLGPELAIVDREFHAEVTQADCRRWEYAQTLRAVDWWREQAASIDGHPVIYDVGGAGSPFIRMLPQAWSAGIVDPKIDWTLAEYVRHLHPALADLVTCLSVVEHVEQVEEFLYHLSCLVAPGGVLVLTTDCRENQPCAAPDDRHFHWDRKRIFCPWRIEASLISPLMRLGFREVGGTNLTYTEHYQNWGYTVASLVMQKRS